MIGFSTAFGEKKDSFSGKIIQKCVNLRDSDKITPKFGFKIEKIDYKMQASEFLFILAKKFARTPCERLALTFTDFGAPDARRNRTICQHTVTVCLVAICAAVNHTFCTILRNSVVIGATVARSFTIRILHSLEAGRAASLATFPQAFVLFPLFLFPAFFALCASSG